jgi:hypothetical protein
MLAGLQKCKDIMKEFAAAVNKLSLDFNENHDPDDGRFAEKEGGGSSKGESASQKKAERIAEMLKSEEIKGDVLPPIDDYLAKRGIAKGATEYLKEHLQGKHIIDSAKTKVRFTKQSVRKFANNISREVSEALPYTAQIIAHGKREEQEIRPKEDGTLREDFSKIIVYTKNVEVNGAKRTIGIKAGKLKKHDVDTEALRAYSIKELKAEDKKNGVTAGKFNLTPSVRAISYDDSLEDFYEIVNIFFEGEEDLKADSTAGDTALALDKRYKDENGYLRVSASNLTKEQVAEYYGREICGDNTGYITDKIYKVYRPAEELQKAVHTFNGVPVLIKHKADSAENPQKELRVGVTGTEAAFDGKYIKNTLIFHDAAAIELIETGEQQELSAGYKYTPVEEKGEFNGEGYEIRMTNIVANHIAIVQQGRAGSDVRVADIKQPVKEDKDMGKKLERIRSILGLGADSKPNDIAKVVQALDEKEEEEKGEKKDVTLDDLFGEADPIIKKIGEKHKEEGEALSEIFGKIKTAAGDLIKDRKAKDEDKEEGKGEGEESKKEDGKKAEDSKVFDEAAFEKRLEAKFKAKENAAEEVFPIVGRIVTTSFDSAEAIYAFALSESGYDPKQYSSTSYKNMVDVLRRGGKTHPPITQDGKEAEKPRFDMSHFKIL